MNDLDNFAEAIRPLLTEDRLNPLGPGEPNTKAQPLLEKLALNDLTNGAPLVDPDMGRCCLAGLWLYHNFLDESHTISQSVETTTGSLWHAIMHRREPDAGNAAYWLRRVGDHPIFDQLTEKAKSIAADFQSEDLMNPLIKFSHWDPFAFTDLCDKSRDKHNLAEDFCKRIQLAEWQLLFTFCLTQATVHL
jgi:hypothetical protein